MLLLGEKMGILDKLQFWGNEGKRRKQDSTIVLFSFIYLHLLSTWKFGSLALKGKWMQILHNFSVAGKIAKKNKISLNTTST